MAVDTMKVSEMAARILAIPGGEEPDPITISVSGSGLITATDGLSTATRQMATEAGYVITPSTSQQTAIAAQTYCTGAIRVAGDADLIASNIKNGVNIFGVTGSYSPDRTTYASSAAEVLSDDRTGFKYALPSNAPAGRPDLIMVNSQIADPATFLDTNTWAPGSCAYLWAGSYFKVVGTWFYKASGGTFANSMQNVVLPQAACQITREDNNLIFTLGTYMSLYSPLAKTTGNSHKAYCVWF